MHPINIFYPDSVISVQQQLGILVKLGMCPNLSFIDNEKMKKITPFQGHN